MASLSRTARRQLRPGSPSGYFVKANGRLIKANCRFIKANSHFIKAGFSKPATAIYQGQPQWQLYDGCSGKGQPLGLARRPKPLLRGFDRGRPRWPIYQSQLQPEGPTLRSSSRRLDPLLRRVSSLSTAGRPRWPVYQGQLQPEWPNP